LQALDRARLMSAHSLPLTGNQGVFEPIACQRNSARVFERASTQSAFLVIYAIYLPLSGTTLVCISFHSFSLGKMPTHHSLTVCLSVLQGLSETKYPFVRRWDRCSSEPVGPRHGGFAQTGGFDCVVGRAPHLGGRGGGLGRKNTTSPIVHKVASRNLVRLRLERLSLQICICVLWYSAG
jgi:hypothetical protein